MPWRVFILLAQKSALPALEGISNSNVMEMALIMH
jgi:hypothetical protein